MITNNFIFDFYSLIMEAFLFFNISFILMFGTISSNSSAIGFPVLNKSIRFLSTQTLFLTFLLGVYQNPIFMISWGNSIVVDSYSFYSKLIILFFSTIFFLILTTDYKDKSLNFEFWVLLLLSILALCFLVQSYNLLIIYLSIEFMSLIFYVLSSLKRNSEFSAEAGLKYFILGAFSSALLLFGFTLLYSLTGIINLLDFSIFCSGFFNDQKEIELSFAISISLFFVLSALLFKLGSAPFHFWLPDVYEGAPSSVTAFFAIIPKIGILSLFSRFFLITFFDFFLFKIYYFISISIFLSSLVGTFGAFQQKKWKRFIAFSSISQLSFFLLSMSPFNSESLHCLIIYLIIYTIMVTGFFSWFSHFSILKFPNVLTSRLLTDLTCLSFYNSSASISLSLILFSMAGIPPLAGFFTKFIVLFLPISTKFFSIILFILILNCIACFYYIKIIKIIYFDNIFDNKLFPVVINLSYSNCLILGSCVLILVLFVLNFSDYVLLSNLIFSFLI